MFIPRWQKIFAILYLLCVFLSNFCYCDFAQKKNSTKKKKKNGFFCFCVRVYILCVYVNDWHTYLSNIRHRHPKWVNHYSYNYLWMVCLNINCKGHCNTQHCHNNTHNFHMFANKAYNLLMYIDHKTMHVFFVYLAVLNHKHISHN